MGCPVLIHLEVNLSHHSNTVPHNNAQYHSIYSVDHNASINRNGYQCLVSRSQTYYALANLLDGALAVKGLGTYAWPARASCNYSCSTNQIAAFSKLAYLACDVYEENVCPTEYHYCNQYFHFETA